MLVFHDRRHDRLRHPPSGGRPFEPAEDLLTGRGTWWWSIRWCARSPRSTGSARAESSVWSLVGSRYRVHLPGGAGLAPREDRGIRTSRRASWPKVWLLGPRWPGGPGRPDTSGMQALGRLSRDFRPVPPVHLQRHHQRQHLCPYGHRLHPGLQRHPDHQFRPGPVGDAGRMVGVALYGAGLPLWACFIGAVAIVTADQRRYRADRHQAADAKGVLAQIIATVGASFVFETAAMLIWGRDAQPLPPFSGDDPIASGGATIVPQTLWVVGLTVVIVIGLQIFYRRTLFGTADTGLRREPQRGADAGHLVQRVVMFSFALTGAISAAAGVMITPISFMSYSSGTLLGLKGFAAATLGGLGTRWARWSGGSPRHRRGSGCGCGVGRLQGRHRLRDPAAGAVPPPGRAAGRQGGEQAMRRRRNAGSRGRRAVFPPSCAGTRATWSSRWWS